MPRAIIPYTKALPEAPGRTPRTKPDVYLEKLGEGDYAVRQGRRPSIMFLVEKLRQHPSGASKTRVANQSAANGRVQRQGQACQSIKTSYCGFFAL